MSTGRQRVARICVIIVNWNGRQHLEHCLPSVAATDYPNFGVMVVDNGSSDDSLSWLRANYPEAETVALAGEDRSHAAITRSPYYSS